MKTGMLWHHEISLAEESAAQLETLINQAVKDYHTWYGINPSVCYMNPEELGNHRRRLVNLQMQLSPSDQLEPGQFWLGQ